MWRAFPRKGLSSAAKAVRRNDFRAVMRDAVTAVQRVGRLESLDQARHGWDRASVSPSRKGRRGGRRATPRSDRSSWNSRRSWPSVSRQNGCASATRRPPPSLPGSERSCRRSSIASSASVPGLIHLCSRDQHDLAGVFLEQELRLSFHDGAQRIGAGDQWLDFIPLDVADQVLEYSLVEHRAAQQA